MGAEWTTRDTALRRVSDQNVRVRTGGNASHHSRLSVHEEDWMVLQYTDTHLFHLPTNRIAHMLDRATSSRALRYLSAAGHLTRVAEFELRNPPGEYRSPPRSSSALASVV